MNTSNTPLAALQLFELTYAPGYKANGTPIDRTASRQVLAHRLTAQEEGLTADGAIDAFEQREGRMVTACKRVQFTDGVEA
jgi:hypothetical protein